MSTHFLALAGDRAVVASQMQQLAAAHPGKSTHTLAFSLNEFERCANAEKGKVDWILLGPMTTDQDEAAARQIVANVWGGVKNRKDELGPGKWVLRIPASMMNKQGQEGGMVEWVGAQVES